ncbi:MAG: protein translocase SEC61 complex subunit gamma [Candidatus Aenigmarchaeota archaeon]|nr:protein translocase SEC61 complex subunit gamma [Candidatus Aenigmarchaeota archaeon]
MKIAEALQNYIRILRIAKKADKGEFMETVRICGIGIALVGTIGFLFYVISVFIG